VHDGGARIQGYKLEFRDPAEDQTWRIANDYLVKDNNYTVYGLLPGHEYEFRVRAKNAAGLSKPSGNSSKFKLKPKIGVPSPPGTPTVVKVGKNYADLTWEPPKSDGGSKITGYIIEKREFGGAMWVKCNDYNVQDCEYTALNLVEQGDYEFRIYAVNAAGRSEPSACTTPVKICEVRTVRELLDRQPKHVYVARVAYTLVVRGSLRTHAEKFNLKSRCFLFESGYPLSWVETTSLRLDFLHLN